MDKKDIISLLTIGTMAVGGILLAALDSGANNCEEKIDISNEKEETEDIDISYVRRSPYRRYSNYNRHHQCDCGYFDAFKAVMESDMLNAYKESAVAIIMKEQDPEYYKSVIKVVNDNTLSINKLRMIGIINNTFKI